MIHQDPLIKAYEFFALTFLVSLVMHYVAGLFWGKKGILTLILIASVGLSGVIVLAIAGPPDLAIGILLFLIAVGVMLIGGWVIGGLLGGLGGIISYKRRAKS